MSEFWYVTLSTNDIERIEKDLYPTAKRTVLWISVALLGYSSAFPFLSFRRSVPLVERIGYPFAFLIYSLVFACIVFYIFRISVIGLAADLRDGHKCVFMTRVTKKVWKGNEQFELYLEELPKGLAKKKFFYPAAESHCFHQDDVVMLEYLERSSIILSVYAKV